MDHRKGGLHHCLTVYDGCLRDHVTACARTQSKPDRVRWLRCDRKETKDP